MNIPGMMGRGGMMGGAPQASSGDTPQVDTAENVQISSLALLKMLKHGTWRDRRRPRARLHRGSRVDDEPPAKSPNPRPVSRRTPATVSRSGGAPIGRVERPKGFLNRSGASRFRSRRFSLRVFFSTDDDPPTRRRPRADRLPLTLS
jgi:hypothetical protein